MVVKKGHKLFGKVVLLDVIGRKIPWVYSYNTKTKVARFYLTTTDKTGKTRVALSGNMNTVISRQSQIKAVKSSVRIPGAVLVYRKSGRRVVDSK